MWVECGVLLMFNLVVHKITTGPWRVDKQCVGDLYCVCKYHRKQFTTVISCNIC